MYKKNYRDLEEKCKSYQNKNLELQSQIEQRRNEIDRMRRNTDNLGKELNEEKQKQKSLRRNLKNKEEEVVILNGELENFKQRFRSGDQMTKLEI